MEPPRVLIVDDDEELEIREHAIFPVPVRFNQTDPPLRPNDVVNMIVEAVQTAATEQGIDGEVGATGSLWEFFKTTDFWLGDTLLVPLLVLDQFEEVFALNPPQTRTRFVDLVLRLVTEARVHAVLVLRDDFLWRCHRCHLVPAVDQRRCHGAQQHCGATFSVHDERQRPGRHGGDAGPGGCACRSRWSAWHLRAACAKEWQAAARP